MQHCCHRTILDGRHALVWLFVAVTWLTGTLIVRVHADEVVLPGPVSWLGPFSLEQAEQSPPPPPWKEHLPFSYIIYGPQAVAIVRIVTHRNATCPKLVVNNTDSTLDNDALPEVILRAEGVNRMPHVFPIKVCQVSLTEAVHKEAWTKGELVLEYSHNNMSSESKDPKNDMTPNVPILTDPQKFGLVGDTGLRVKPKNLGINCSSATSPPLWEVPQCPENFTQDDLTGFPVQGDFQPLTNWPLKGVLDHLADQQPDVVVYVGDYLYRQGPCPAENQNNASCSNINYSKSADLNNTSVQAVVEFLNGTIANFLPADWGDTMSGWWADFFYPALDLLKTAPIIAIRGNHEICDRAGFGYFLFMSPLDYPPGIPAGSWCKEFESPFSVPFENEQFLIMDDSAITPYLSGVDHFTETILRPDGGFDVIFEQIPSDDSSETQFVGSIDTCPGPPGPDDGPIIPVVQSRFWDPNQSNETILAQVARYSREMEVLGNLSLSHATNFYAAHRPLFAVDCNDTWMVTLDWTMQESLGPNTLDRVSASINGHMHWLEVLSFYNDTLPKQIVVGHGGTKLIDNNVHQDALKGMWLRVGREQMYSGVIEKGITSSEGFGFGIMERDGSGDYKVIFKNLNQTSGDLYDVDFNLAIPKGPRVNIGALGTTSTTTATGGIQMVGTASSSATRYVPFPGWGLAAVSIIYFSCIR